MAKQKLNLSLDSAIKEALELYAKDRHTTVSAIITEFALKLPTSKSVKGQMTIKDYKG